LRAGSRNRELTLDNDNAGFMDWAVQNKNIERFFMHYPKLRLYGEFLVPHTLKTYYDHAWRNFYVFDVMDGEEYLMYEHYKELLDAFDINYIVPICKIKNPTDDTIYACLDKNTYLIKDNEGTGEGIVIKRYDYKNKYGRTTWAKIVKTEFKIQNQKVFGPTEIKEKNTV